MHSPYRGTRPSRWPRITQQLVERHPLSPKEIVDVVLLCWDSILASSIGTRGFRIGADIFPKPQIMGFFLHELMPLELQARYPGIWRPDASGKDKDLVPLQKSFAT